MSRPRRGSGDQPISLSGWLYADIFLALVVVGLSTAWITKSSPPPPKPTETTTTTTVAATTTTTTTTPPKPHQFQLSCTELFVGPKALRGTPAAIKKNIADAIAYWVASKGLTSETARPGMVLVYAGFSTNLGQGNYDASVFLKQLRTIVPSFRRVEMRFFGARDIRVNGEKKDIGGTGANGLVIYLVYEGEPMQEDCTK